MSNSQLYRRERTLQAKMYAKMWQGLPTRPSPVQGRWAGPDPPFHSKPSPHLSVAGIANMEPLLITPRTKAEPLLPCYQPLPWRVQCVILWFSLRPLLPSPLPASPNKELFPAKVQRKFPWGGGWATARYRYPSISFFFKKFPKRSFHEPKDNSGPLEAPEWGGGGGAIASTINRSGGPERGGE